MSDTMNLDNPVNTEEKRLAYTDQQVYEKLQLWFPASLSRSTSFPTDPNPARLLSQALLIAMIRLKCSKDDDEAYKQACDLLDKRNQRESIIEEIRKAWENRNLGSLLESGMW
jgi:inorganic pyrophosphatase/exopolyphosphatase